MENKYFEEIEQLQKQIDELKEKIKEQESQPVKRWRANLGGDYYYVNNNLLTAKDQEKAHNVNNVLYKLGNYFQTEQEARNYRDNILTKQELKDLALELNDGVEIDWENRDQRKYFIIYDNHIKNFIIDFWHDSQYVGQVYCLDQNFLEIAKERIGEDRLIKLIKSGV
ncbi:MAG: hypothetical protein MJ180_00065 [Candidatus Gastranaerophilales bacterium]|nr:hypothetical protein [Candidatus Gastranaerophilales bacterium]